MTDKKLQRIYGMSVASIYPLYVTKVEKARTIAEVNEVNRWLVKYELQ
jgi:hypothetical protein